MMKLSYKRESQQYHVPWIRILFEPLILALLWLFMPTVATAVESVCATVKIEIHQELTYERQAFDAQMRINNGLDTAAVENVLVEVYFTDELGNPVLASSDPNSTDALFYIRIDSLENIGAVDGTGTVLPNTAADIHWLIIPTAGAGGEDPTGTLYYVGATLSYTLAGEVEVTEVVPDYIRVSPLPQLTLDYFLTRDVYADDAFTPEIEPAVPFTLGLRITNSGFSPAWNVNVISAQPTIVENEQGLLIGFEIIGSSIDDQPAMPTLLLDFGSIDQYSSRVGRWLMETTLSGEFIEFSAEFSHADMLGGELTSVIDAVNTHFLVQDVLVDLTGRDAVRDFLALDAGVLRVYESQGLDTDVADQSGVSTLTLTSEDGSLAYYTLTTPVTAGFVYVQQADPYAGAKTITRVTRSDGKRLPMDNAWSSKVRQADTTWAYYVNFFDVNTTGSYTVVFDDPPELPNQKPVLQFIADATVEEGQQLSFLVEASDPEGVVPTLSAAPLPAGATFVDHGNGEGIFDWTPDIGQAGTYEVTFTASDGVLSTSQLVVLTVTTPPPIEIQIEFAQGFNLFGYPMTVVPEHSTCLGLFNAIGTVDEVESISQLNTATGLFESCDHTGDFDFPVTAGGAYIVQMNMAKTVTFTGFMTCPSVLLLAGQNLVGHPKAPTDLSCFSLLQYLGESLVGSIQHFNVLTGAFETCVWFDELGTLVPAGTDFPIYIGQGLLLHMQADLLTPLPGCQ